jgi:hypothetical protein
MKKLLVGAGLAGAGLLGMAVLARNFIARKSVELGVERITGFPLTIQSVHVGLFNGQLDVAGLKLMNPPGFEERQFVDLKNLHVDYRLGSMLAGAPHINDMLVDIDHLVIVKNTNGVSNAQKLKGVSSSNKPSKTKYRVDVLRIHVGHVTVKDFARAKPTTKNLRMDITATYRDITDSTDITRLVLMTVMSQARIPEIGLNADDLKRRLGGVEGVAGEMIGTTTNILDQTGKSLLDSIKRAVPQK